MRKILKTTLFVSVITTSGAVFAQDALPDLKGTWTIKSQGLLIKHQDRSIEPTHHESVCVVDWQEGASFSGHEIEQDFIIDSGPTVNDEKFIGAIAPDGKMALIVDENGFRDCWITSAEAMTCIYRHIQPDRNVANRDEWVRQPD